MSWFYESNGVQQGPVSDVDLDRLVAEGKVLPTTLVWREGLPNWTPLAQARAGVGPAAFAPTPGTTQCQACGRVYDDADVVQIAGRNICASCKPAVLQGLQQGTFVGIGDPERSGPDWEQKETLGFFIAARNTVKAVLMEPTKTFSTMKVDGGIGNPFWFNLLFAGIGNVVLLIVMTVAQVGMSSFNPALRDASMQGAMFGPMFIFQLVWSFVGVAIGTFLQAGIIHVCLMICGGARRPYEATYRALAYGGGAVGMLHLIPVIGSIAAIPWGLVVYCIGLSRTHETDLWRVVLAIFLPAIVCCVVLFVIFAIGFGVASTGHH